MRVLRIWLLAPCFVAAFSQVPQGRAEQVISSYVTFYGFDDNDDGDPRNTGTDVISHPSIHPGATEDLGTYDRPGTLATDTNLIQPGTIVYIPALERYYVMEDTCRACSRNWSNNKAHVDVYVDGTGPALVECEERLTMERTDIIIDPPSNLPVRKGSACDSSRPPSAVHEPPSALSRNNDLCGQPAPPLGNTPYDLDCNLAR